MDEGQAPDEVLAMLTLDGEGHILQCNGAMTDLSGYTQRELCSRHVSSIFPGLMYLHLLDEHGINPKLRYLCLAGFPFRLRRQDSGWSLCRMRLMDLDGTSAPGQLRIMVSPAPAASYVE